MKRIFCLGVFLSLGVFHASLLRAAPAEASAEKHVPMVRVNATDQAWDFFHPWTKHAPVSGRAVGAVLPNKEILVTAELVANANFVELEKAESGEKVAASVDAVDYEANLALLKPSDAAFLDGIAPLEIADSAVGDRVAVWQLKSTGALLETSALVTTVETSRYPIDDTSLLIYRLTSSLQYREGSFTVPIVKNNQLTGLLMRYDTRTQNVDVIPAPVIQHFLKDAASQHYGGFPRAGVLFSALRDPQLRRYAGLNGDHANNGIYVTEVQKNSPADKAGIRVGDVILAVGDQAIDTDGNYLDARYGKTSMVHLIAMKADGERVPFQVFRAGKTESLEVTLAHRAAADYLIEPYTIDTAPRYYVLGGLVLQELSRQYLKEWGDWQKKAPEKFVYLDRYQSDLFSNDPRKRIVFISHVLPSPSTVGCEQMSSIVVNKINDVPLGSLADVVIALQKPVDGFHKLELDDIPHIFYLDAKQVEADNEALMKNYGIPSISRMR